MNSDAITWSLHQLFGWAELHCPGGGAGIGLATINARPVCKTSMSLQFYFSILKNGREKEKKEGNRRGGRLMVKVKPKVYEMVGIGSVRSVEIGWSCRCQGRTT